MSSARTIGLMACLAFIACGLALGDVTVVATGGAPADRAQEQVEQIAGQLQNASQQSATISQRMERGRQGLREIQARIDRAGSKLDACQREMAVADLPYGAAKFAEEQVRLDAVQQFNDSAEYQAALREISTAATALQRASGSELQSAQNRLATAKTKLDSIRAKFTEDLPRIPKVAVADAALKSEETRYAAMSQHGSEAQKDLADARAQLQRQQAGLAADQSALDRIAGDVSSLRETLFTAQTAANQAGEQALVQARAAAPVQENIPEVSPGDAPPAADLPSTYANPPAPIVYGQPASGDVYSGPYYGGAIVVTPRDGHRSAADHRWQRGDRGGDQGQPGQYQNRPRQQAPQPQTPPRQSAPTQRSPQNYPSGRR